MKIKKEVIATRTKALKIKELREASGLTIADVARTMQVDYAAAHRWDTGEKLPRIEKLPALADLFGCTIDALFGREPPRAAS